jgi:Flp pilus assembly protein TadG
MMFAFSIHAMRILRDLRRNRSGNVAMMFTLLVIPIVAAIGLAIDMGRIYHVSMHTQGALDAAALAAGRVAQVEKTDTLTKANKAASAYFDQAKPTDIIVTNIEFSPNAQQTEFTVTATSWVKTPFLSVLDFISPKKSQDDAPAICKGNHYACTKVVSKATAQICLNCSDTGAGNADEGTNLEIAMMLDVTGSMGGQPIKDLISAAKDLVDIVVWDDQSKYTSKVALVPFAPAVNVGAEYFTAITGKSDEADPDGDGYNYPSSCYSKKTGKLKGSCEGDSEYKVKVYAKCVVERTGADQFTDAAPSTSYLPTWNDATGNSSTNCSPSAKIVPLTKDRKVLKDTIDTFKASGTTAGQLGTAFAWYLLSPNWKNVWPAKSEPTPYGTPKVKKIAILMTDGEYNTLQGHQYSDGSSQAVTATSNALSLCTAMKKNAKTGDPNIEIYAVGFSLDTTASKNLLKNCATKADHYYETSSGDGLKAAFRDIALRISKLRLTN